MRPLCGILVWLPSELILSQDSQEGEAFWTRSDTDESRSAMPSSSFRRCAGTVSLSPAEEIAIVGDPASGKTRDLLKVLYETYRPSKVVAVGLPSDDGEEAVPLLAGRRRLDERATAYACQHFACQAPVTGPEALAVDMKRC